jgi:hypothetical protein
MLGFFIAGCSEGDKSSSVTNPNPNVFAPTGSISGTVFDSCANLPVQGARVSVAYSGGVHQVTTGVDGSFSFSGVPANEEDISSTEASSGTAGPYYAVTCDLTTVTGNPYDYATIMPAYVTYSDLGDGTNGTAEDSHFTESGSGASTPVNNLASSITFYVAKPTATIDVTVTDNTAVDTGTGIVTGTPIAANTDGVLLFKRLVVDEQNFDTFMGYGTPGATTGSYTFSNVVPLSPLSDENYYVLVLKTGYTVSYNGSEETGTDCIGLELACQPGCNQTVSAAFTVVNNPTIDTTAPVITSIVVPGGPAAASTLPGGGSFYGDVITQTATTVTPFADFVITFDKAMNTSHTTKNGIQILDKFSVLLTSAGAAPHGVNYQQTVSVDIIDRSDASTDFALAWTTGGLGNGILTLTPKLATAEELRLLGNATTESWAVGSATITSYNSGAWEIRLGAGNSDFLFDTAFNKWSMDSDSSYNYFQDDFLFIEESQLGGIDDGYHWYFWIGQGNVRSDFAAVYEE